MSERESSSRMSLAEKQNRALEFVAKQQIEFENKIRLNQIIHSH